MGLLVNGKQAHYHAFFVTFENMGVYLVDRRSGGSKPHAYLSSSACRNGKKNKNVLYNIAWVAKRVLRR